LLEQLTRISFASHSWRAEHSDLLLLIYREDKCIEDSVICRPAFIYCLSILTFRVSVIAEGQTHLTGILIDVSTLSHVPNENPVLGD